LNELTAVAGPSRNARPLLPCGTWDSAEHAAHLAKRTALAEGVLTGPARPVLHGDNGATLKATTVLAMLNWLGITPSHSRPRVSDDNAFAEALFRTAKYRPELLTIRNGSVNRAESANSLRADTGCAGQRTNRLAELPGWGSGSSYGSSYRPYSPCRGPGQPRRGVRWSRTRSRRSTS
jgi:transposase InsO family protein